MYTSGAPTLRILFREGHNHGPRRPVYVLNYYIHDYELHLQKYIMLNIEGAAFQFSKNNKQNRRFIYINSSKIYKTIYKFNFLFNIKLLRETIWFTMKKMNKFKDLYQYDF